MCGLFGFSTYCDQPIKNLSILTNSLAEQSAVRGIDATGIAYGKNGGITLYKEPKSAYSSTASAKEKNCISFAFR